MGLKSDGIVVAAGYDTSKWKNIIKIAGSDTHIAGLKSDGTVVVIGGEFGQAIAQKWEDIVDIAAGWNTTVGLRKDGTVIAIGFNKFGACNTEGMKDAISASYHTACLKADGTVEAVGNNDFGQCDVSDWTDIIGISNMLYCTLALKKTDLLWHWEIITFMASLTSPTGFNKAFQPLLYHSVISRGIVRIFVQRSRDRKIRFGHFFDGCKNPQVRL